MKMKLKLNDNLSGYIKLIIIVFLCLHTVFAKSAETDTVMYKILYDFLKKECLSDSDLLELRGNETLQDKIYVEDILDIDTTPNQISYWVEYDYYNVPDSIYDATPDSVRDKLFSFYATIDTVAYREWKIDVQKQFAVYQFYIEGVNHFIPYVLIKLYSDFYIYDGTDINRIVMKLLYINQKYPDLLTNSLFIACVDKLVIHYRFDELAKYLGHNTYYYFDIKKIQQYIP